MEAEKDQEAESMMKLLKKNLKESVKVDLYKKILLKSKLVRDTFDE
jgi:translation initiation factor 2 beta subunit (eIF-2beta)/eIF-5